MPSRRDVEAGGAADNEFGAEAAKALLPALLNMPAMESLDLGCAFVCGGAAHGARRDTCGVAANELGVEGAETLAPALAAMTRMSNLDLQCACAQCLLG